MKWTEMEKPDINMIVKLVYTQFPGRERMDVVQALKESSDNCWVSDQCFTFLHPLRHPEYGWKERVTLRNGKNGLIHIDLAKDGRLIEIEFEKKSKSNGDF